MGGVDDPYIASDADDCADESDVAALVLQHSLPLIMLKESTMTVTIAIRANRKRGNEQYLRCIGPEELHVGWRRACGYRRSKGRKVEKGKGHEHGARAGGRRCSRRH